MITFPIKEGVLILLFWKKEDWRCQVHQGTPGEAMGLRMFLGASQLDNTRQASVAGAQGMRGQLTSIFEEDDMGGTTEEQLKGCPAVWWSASQKCKSWCHG